MPLVDPSNNLQAVAHPLLIRRYQERVLYEIRNYLVLGPPDPEVVKVPLGQLMELLDWAEAKLLEAHPQRAEEIRDAIRLRRESLVRDARNPFIGPLRKPIGPHVIEKAKQEWARDFAEMQDGDINFAITSGYLTAVNGSYGPRLPGTESYRAAHDAVAANAVEIDAWQSQELEKQRDAFFRSATSQPSESENQPEGSNQ